MSAIWEEVFEPGKPTPPHRHMRDYIAHLPRPWRTDDYPAGRRGRGIHRHCRRLQGGADGEGSDTGGLECGGHAPFASAGERNWPLRVNEGLKPALMILIEIKGTATEKSMN